MRLTIKYKLFAAFAAVLAMMALLGFTAASSTSRMSADTEVFDQKMLPSARTVGELKNQTGKFRRDQVRYTAAPDAAARKDIAEGLAEDVAAIDELVTDYKTKLITGAEDQRALEAFTTVWAQYKSASADLPALTDAGQAEAGLALIESGAGDKGWDDTKAALTTLDKVNEEFATATIAQVRADAASTRTFALVLLGIALAIAVGLAWWLSRTLSGGANRLVRAAHGIAEGDVEQQVEIRSNDELGDAGREFERMIAYLQEAAVTADRIAAGDLTHEITPRGRERRARPRAAPHVRQPARDARRRRRLRPPTVASASSADGRHVRRDRPRRGRDRRRHLEHRRRAPSASCTRSRRRAQMIAEVAAGVGESAAAAQETAAAVNDAAAVAQEGVGAAEQATAAMHAVRESSPPRPPSPSATSAPAPSRSAGSSTPSPAWPSRRTCSRSTPPSRPPGPASRARASPSWPRRSASWPRSPRPPPPRSPASSSRCRATRARSWASSSRPARAPRTARRRSSRRARRSWPSATPSTA